MTKPKTLRNVAYTGIAPNLGVQSKSAAWVKSASAPTFKYAIEHEAMVYPLYFREAKNELRSSFTEDGNEENIALNKASVKIKDIQYRDFRKYKNKDVYCEKVQDFLDRLAHEIA